MTRDELRQILLTELSRLAPEADLASLRPDRRLREELDLDSFDFVRFIAAVAERCGLGIAEAEYTHFETLGGALEHLEAKLTDAGRARASAAAQSSIA